MHALSQLLMHVIMLSPFDKACLSYSCSYTDMSCSVVDINSFKGTKQNRCLPPHLRTETDPVSGMLCSLVFRIPDDRRSPKTPVILNVIHHLQKLWLILCREIIAVYCENRAQTHKRDT
jgi:hypothetical protein